MIMIPESVSTVSRSSTFSSPREAAPEISRVTRAVVTLIDFFRVSTFHTLPKFVTATVVFYEKVTMTLVQLRCGACQPPANETSCTLISHRRHAQLPISLYETNHTDFSPSLR